MAKKSSTPSRPAGNFYIGGGDIDPRLESLLTGLQAGDHRTFELEPGAAFGSHDGMVHDLPRAEFAADPGTGARP
jgi:FKBP-type peptidyl-prolyl cis-trans isomerase 2